MKTIQRLALVLGLPAIITLAACGGDTDSGAMETPDQMPEEPDVGMVDTATVLVADVGLQTPESVLFDPAAGIYIVSNINGAPTDEDGNGFISRVAPDGTVESLKWIDGQADGVTLNAPKGLAFKGDTLFVADITAVRAFDRTSGDPLGSWEVPGSTFLNDVVVGPDGTLYVSDSGLNPDFTSSGTDAVYRFDDGEPVAVVQDTALHSPNGIAIDGADLVVVSFGAPEVWTVATATGEMEVIDELDGGQLDGVQVLPDGSMLVSSWATSSVYWIPATGSDVETAVTDVPSPADIGWDSQRSRVLIPIFNENRLVFRYVGIPSEPAVEEQQPEN